MFSYKRHDSLLQPFTVSRFFAASSDTKRQTEQSLWPVFQLFKLPESVSRDADVHTELRIPAELRTCEPRRGSAS